jgi:hypothetical protein
MRQLHTSSGKATIRFLVVLGLLGPTAACSGRTRSRQPGETTPPVAGPVDAAAAADAPSPDATGAGRLDVAPAGDVAAAAAAPPVPAGPPVFPPLAAAAPALTTEDGLPVLEVSAESAGREGGVQWVFTAWNTLHYAQYHASDGRRVLLAVANRYQEHSDVLIRDGRIYTDVLRGLAEAPANPGGCGAAADGTVLLSAPPEPGGRQGPQHAWIVAPDGTVRHDLLPEYAGAGSDCQAALDPDGRYAVATFRVSVWDGTQFAIDDVWSEPRLRMGGARGPWYCFDSCNAGETAANDPNVDVLKTALDCSAEYAVHGEWLAGRCRQGNRVVRLKRGGTPEVSEAIPGLPTSKVNDLVLTLAGDVVAALDYGFASYMVWSATGAVSPQRRLAAGEVLSEASPTLLVRGLPPDVPEAVVAAVELGRSLPFGASGSTYGYAGISRTGEAHAAQVARARAVLPRSERLVVAHEAVVDLACGAYVRSPIGWEGAQIEDWTPPVLPALHRAAVHDPPECLPLEAVTAVPGVPDLLLARTADGELAAAWLPPPLPLPSGTSHFHDQGPPPPPPVQHPRPGTGWTRLGPVAAVVGEPGVPAPGADTAIADDTWQAGGAALVATGAAEILLTPTGAATLPAGATPRAVMLYAPGAYGALGHQLVACDAARCRILDPGPRSAIVAVVPRTATTVVLGYEDGRIGTYEVPAEGGEAVTENPLASRLRTLLAARPTE